MNSTSPKPLHNDCLIIDDGKPLKPLSYTVIDFIFREEMSGGKIMHGLANAILEDSGDKPISSIISIQPQRYQYGAGGRWYRLDVFAETSDNEIVLLEVQVKKQPNFNTRSMLYAMSPLQSRIRKGDDWNYIAKNMTRVISLNLLDFELRSSSAGFHQVIESVYREPPHEVAEHHHVTHNIELPKFRRITPDFNNTLHMWLTTICRAQDENRTLREVVDMEPKLKQFATDNQSFCQYILNYDIANLDEETRREYSLEILNLLLEKESILMQMEESREEGHEEGRKEGRKEGREEGREEGRKQGIDISAEIIGALLENKPAGEIASQYSIPVEKVEKLHAALQVAGKA